MKDYGNNRNSRENITLESSSNKEKKRMYDSYKVATLFNKSYKAPMEAQIYQRNYMPIDRDNCMAILFMNSSE